MRYFVGLQIPDPLKTQAINFCARHQYTLKDPYITLISPQILGDLVGIEQKLQSFCLAQAVFPVTLSLPVMAASGKAVIFPVMPGHITLMRGALLSYLRVAAKGGQYRAHYTLIQQQKKWTVDLEPVLADAQAAFTNAVTLTLDSLTLYSSPGEDVSFSQMMTIPFTGR